MAASPRDHAGLEVMVATPGRRSTCAEQRPEARQVEFLVLDKPTASSTGLINDIRKIVGKRRSSGRHCSSRTMPKDIAELADDAARSGARRRDAGASTSSASPSASSRSITLQNRAAAQCAKQERSTRAGLTRPSTAPTSGEGLAGRHPAMPSRNKSQNHRERVLAASVRRDPHPGGDRHAARASMSTASAMW